MNKNSILRYALIIIFIPLTFHYAAAQAGRGTARLAGTVTDEQGNPISSAKVVIEFMGRDTAARETTTDQKGEWNFMGIGSGNWRITASAEGFVPAIKDMLISQIERNPKVSMALKRITEVEASVIEQTDLGLIDQAGQLFTERKYDEAMALLQEFLDKNPTAYPTHINIGDCYKEKGEYEKAEQEYNLALEAAKTDEKLGKDMTAKAMAGIGDIYLKKGDFEKAQSFFQKSIALLPENEILAYNVGEIYFSNQKLEEAIQYFGVAIQIKPDWSLPYYKQGLVYLNKTDYERAEENFKKFLEIDPNSELAASVKNMLEYLEKIKK